MIVADTNLIVYLFITGDQTPLAQDVLAKDPHWIVPPLWQSEFRNVLAGYIRRGMELSQAQEIMRDALLTLENRQVAPSSEKVFELVSKSDCTAYDCEFIALAQQLNILLVTSDKQLLQRFPGSAIALKEFIK
ncbi:MAG: type II toxin-antitoxin system VapC family toxin [Anaerolineae bacterium]|nr:type II toxin-antitoxin system VapC family toxin [Anaerolineae bacterium]MBL8106690.1 type II toxin-antitoxin system VapC family toxin [Anaerolineales bacterium]MCC7187490.1 type II toxin-antitoxin system VapC family toxin [Anaerolineales bacterium]